MVRWLLLALAIAVSGCAPAAVDALPVPTAQPTRPTLSLPTHPAGTALPHIPSSWELTPLPRTPLALRATQGGLAPSGSDVTPTPGLTSQVSPTPPVPTATRAAPSATPHTHRFAVSTRARTYYYCDTDSEWKGLSAANLRWYDSERALKADYPRLTLHAPCE